IPISLLSMTQLRPTPLADRQPLKTEGSSYLKAQRPRPCRLT
ncbi:hypothetical protein CCACVL1_28171, partial [Corchorus capsularis]